MVSTFRGRKCRLWCVFEVAAYRTANPTGKITLAPLFVEATVAALWTGGCLVPLLYLLAMRVGMTLNYALLLALVPLFLGIHFLRASFRVKRRLLEEPEQGSIKTRSDRPSHEERI